LLAVFGLKPGAETESLARLLMRFADVGLGSSLLLLPALQWDLGRFSPWGRIVHLRREAETVLLAEIARRRADPSHESRRDILSMLLSATNEDGQRLSDSDLTSELLTMLLAGHETTATSLAWTFERILSHPEVQTRIEAELETVLGADPLDRSRLPKLEYLDAVIKESFRFRPIMPGSSMRRLVAPLRVGGYDLPPGTIIVNCSYLLHRRPDVYPDPETFRPERFLGKNTDPYEWTPFGGGVRRCLGMAFALYEMKVVLATVLSRARLRLPRPGVRAVRRGTFLGPERGLVVQLAETKLHRGSSGSLGFPPTGEAAPKISRASSSLLE
jgi:cytochrome P450 family 110